ncbi:PCI-domain-containing protein, partial [Coprinopsis marcescibilis]
ALGTLKYMLLCKIMLTLVHVTSLLTIKLAAKYAQLRDVESMRPVARVHQDRNLADFEKALRKYRNELSSDPTIRSHLAALYDTLLQQNLLRIIEPYEVVGIAHVAEVVGQDLQAVEVKLSQMILDKVFSGVLDQGLGCLLVFDRQEEDVSGFVSFCFGLVQCGFGFILGLRLGFWCGLSLVRFWFGFWFWFCVWLWWAVWVWEVCCDSDVDMGYVDARPGYRLDSTLDDEDRALWRGWIRLTCKSSPFCSFLFLD